MEKVNSINPADKNSIIDVMNKIDIDEDNFDKGYLTFYFAFLLV